MTQAEFKTYKHPASVILFELTSQTSDRRYRWGYGFADMLEREKSFNGIGTIKRIIRIDETVTPNDWPDGTKHPEVNCWALVELEDKRIVEISARAVKTVLDPALYETIEVGKPKAKKSRKEA